MFSFLVGLAAPLKEQAKEREERLRLQSKFGTKVAPNTANSNPRGGSSRENGKFGFGPRSFGYDRRRFGFGPVGFGFGPVGLDSRQRKLCTDPGVLDTAPSHWIRSRRFGYGPVGMDMDHTQQ